MSQIVNFVYVNQNVLIEFFDDIINNSLDWNVDTVVKATGFKAFLLKFQTTFLLKALDYIFGHTEVLYNILQKKCFDIHYCDGRVKELSSMLKTNKTEKFDECWQHSENFQEDIVLPRNKTKQDFSFLYDSIVNTICSEIGSRFSSLSCFNFYALLDSSKYADYKKKFPSELMDSFLNTYRLDMFDKFKLRNELRVLYESQDFCLSIHELFDFMIVNDLVVCFPQVHALITLILTIPSTSASAERSFSALKRIHTAERSTQTQERMVRLNLLSIEKEFLHRLSKQENFYDNVIDIFCKKHPRRIDELFN